MGKANNHQPPLSSKKRGQKARKASSSIRHQKQHSKKEQVRIVAPIDMEEKKQLAPSPSEPSQSIITATSITSELEEENKEQPRRQTTRKENHPPLQQPLPTSSSRHPFHTNPLDHCESPRRAYDHIHVVLQEICKLNRKQLEELVLWDPYYCDGSVKRHMQSLGFPNMIHENQDFYKLLRDETTIPKHDVFITNPPYSEDHIDKLLAYVNTHSNRIFLLLLPNWVARKSNFAKSTSCCDPFYLSPVQPYMYEMPEWNRSFRPDHVGEDGHTRPYLSSWYIYAGNDTERLRTRLEQISAKQLRQSPQIQDHWVTAKTIKGLKWKIQKIADKGKKMTKR